MIINYKSKPFSFVTDPFNASAKNEKNASVILTRAVKSMGIALVDVEYTFDKEHSNLISFSIQHDVVEWSEFIYQILTYAECIGFGWYLTGYINKDPDASTEHTNLPGVSFTQWLVYENGTKESA